MSLPGLGLTGLVAQYPESDPVQGSAAAKA